MIKLEKAATKIMAAIGTAVMLFLLFYSWKYTKRLVEPEYYLDEKDSILWNALVGVVLVAVCGALSGVMKKIPAWALHLLAVLGAVTAVILGIRLARAAGAESIADQYYVQRAAMALADGDAEWVLAQDYYGIYPFQLGLAEIFALIFRVAGSTERLVIQQVQAVCGGTRCMLDLGSCGNCREAGQRNCCILWRSFCSCRCIAMLCLSMVRVSEPAASCVPSGVT